MMTEFPFFFWWTISLNMSNATTFIQQSYCSQSPMNDMHLVLIIPLGRRWKSYSFSSTTTVWPALFPPCRETQKLTRLLCKPHASQRKLTAKQHQQLKGSRSKFTILFSSEGRPGNMTPASRGPALYSDTLCPKQNTSFQSETLICGGLLWPALCPSHMSSNAGNVTGVQRRAGRNSGTDIQGDSDS